MSVVVQLKTQTTRGKNPRPLTAAETQALERKREGLEAQMKEAANERVLTRIARHTTAKADRVAPGSGQGGAVTREALQPLISLVAGDESASPGERIEARRNQIELLLTSART